MKSKNPVVNYFAESFQELRKVTWPTTDQLIRMTVITLGFSLAFALVIGLIDLGFSTAFNTVIELIHG